MPLESKSSQIVWSIQFAVIWATGCVIAEMLLGEPIFVGENNDDLLDNITDVIRGLSFFRRKNTQNVRFYKIPKFCIFRNCKFHSSALSRLNVR